MSPGIDPASVSRVSIPLSVVPTSPMQAFSSADSCLSPSRVRRSALRARTSVARSFASCPVNFIGVEYYAPIIAAMPEMYSSASPLNSSCS